MNASTKALRQNEINIYNLVNVASSKNFILIVLLSTLVLFSSLAVVYVKDLSRRNFIELQTEQQIRDQLSVDWGKLLLEESTWSTQARIQFIAQNRLDMVLPAAKSITMVRQ